MQGGGSWGALGAQKDLGPSTGMWGCLFEALMFWSPMSSRKPPISRGRCCRSILLPSPVARAKLPGAVVSGEISLPGHWSVSLLRMPHVVLCLVPASRTDAPMGFVALGGVCSIDSGCLIVIARQPVGGGSSRCWLLTQRLRDGGEHRAVGNYPLGWHLGVARLPLERGDEAGRALCLSLPELGELKSTPKIPRSAHSLWRRKGRAQISPRRFSLKRWEVRYRAYPKPDPQQMLLHLTPSPVRWEQCWDAKEQQTQGLGFCKQ